MSHLDYDFIVIGSGFGGAVSALRLSEKGYRVLVLERGLPLEEKHFPTTNWNLRKWLWLPPLRFFGLFKITFLKHIAILSGVGVGGGSLVYANVLQKPPREFYRSGRWSKLADWEKELQPFYTLASKMMGVATNPRLETGDLALKELAGRIGKAEAFRPTEVGVFFGEPGVTVVDPYFNGEGPPRTGCTFCGGCMLGCRFNAKNTLVKNYLFLAKKQGVKILARAEVFRVEPLDQAGGETGYRVQWKSPTSFSPQIYQTTTKGIVFAGGVTGTVRLLLKLKSSTLPRLSNRIGEEIRTNSESLIGVTTFNKETNFSEGVAIGSVLQTDEHSHLEPVRYPSGSGFWRLLMSPQVHGRNALVRLMKILGDIARHPWKNLRIYFVRDWAKHTQILLHMRTHDATLRFRKGWAGLRSEIPSGEHPTAFIPEAKILAEHFAEIVNGKPVVLLTESLSGIPTTAHIFGGCVMGSSPEEGVIDPFHRVFGYQNMYVCDGSVISANPGINPSLTILALAERAMSKVPPRKAVKW